jgi:outer membrane protein OmpA-like peptidoglycan-associated protein/tetratricopeptide (TPR) repeat protein
MKKIVNSILLMICVLPAFGQVQMANFFFEQGKEFYEDDSYDDAIEQFEKALEKNPNHTDALYYLGYTFYNQENYLKAIEFFNKLDELDPNYKIWHFYLLGFSNIKVGNLEAAENDFSIFLNKYSKAPNLEIYHHKAAFMKYYAVNSGELRKQENTMSEPINLGPNINTISDDMMPQIDPTGTKLYFTSNRQGGFDDIDKDEINDWGEDLYFIEYKNKQWGKATLLPEPINSYENDGTSTFSPDGQIMIYVKCGGEESIGSCDLYLCELEGNTWSNPINIGNVINDEEWDSQPSLSADGQTLAFVSTRGGSYDEGMDIYISKKNRFGQWGVPQNAGSVINTPFGEKSPYLAPDGKTMYFSSEGHPGFGGFDLFVSVYENGKWSQPKNLGAPLNASGEDTYFTISASGEEAYFASDRGGEGKLDLYSIDLPDELKPKPSVIVSGTVKNAKDNNLIGAWVLVEDLQTGDLIATAKSNSETGEYLVVLPSGKNYSVSANKEGFFFYSNKFEVSESAKYEEIKRDIKLEPIEKGARVVLNNIFFETGSAILTQESYIELGKAVDLLESNKKIVIEVGGHTDNVGSDDTNLKLSHDRAKSVRDYLAKAGISFERMQAKGYGETQPVAENETEDGRKANRRTEFVILEN